MPRHPFVLAFALAFALVSSSCAGAPPPHRPPTADDRPPRLRVLVEIDPSEHVERATPVEDTFEPNRWGATDTAYCIVQRFEATQFPAPGVRVTLLVEFVAAK